MNIYEKRMLTALSLSAVLMVLNIFAVTTGMAEGYYSQVSELLRVLLSK